MPARPRLPLALLLATSLAGCDSAGDSTAGFFGTVSQNYEYAHFGTFPAFEACPSLAECSCIPAPDVDLPYVVTGSDWSVEIPDAVTFSADVHSARGDVTVEWRNNTTGQSYFGPEVTVPVAELPGNWDYVFRSVTTTTFVPACSSSNPAGPPRSVAFPLRDYGDPVYGHFAGSRIVWMSYDPSGSFLTVHSFSLCLPLSVCGTTAASYQTDPGFTCKLIAFPRSPNPPVQVSWEKIGGSTYTGNEVASTTCSDLLGQWKVTMTDSLGNSATALSAFDNLRDAGISFQIPD